MSKGDTRRPETKSYEKGYERIDWSKDMVKVLKEWTDGKGRKRHTVLWVKKVECVIPAQRRSPTRRVTRR